MRKILLASHACLASGMKSSVEMVTGPQEHLSAVCAYTEETPAALVYKATWPEEQVFRCTIGTLEATARENGITKTALITVGGFLGGTYARSRLYDPSFPTEFREASR